MTRLHSQITHINANENMSDETIKLINKAVDLAINQMKKNALGGIVKPNKKNNGRAKNSS